MFMRGVLLTILLSLFLFAKSQNYLLKPKVNIFIDKLTKEHNISREYLNRLFFKVIYQQTALSFYNRAIKPLPQKCTTKPNSSRCLGSGSWDKYSHNLLKASRIKKGIAYMKRHKKTLDRAYKMYGVPPQYITAIIGIESYYGANTGKYPVFDTLATLAFETNRRQSFFLKELEAFLVLTYKEGINPHNVKGSYAGAIGLGQFMPSNYKDLVVDFNRDGKISMNNHSDAIGSIAHYLKKSGWKKGLEVAIPVSYFGKRYRAKKTGYRYRYKRVQLREFTTKTNMRYRGDIYLIKLQRSTYDEMWFGTTNFYAITRYNHSDYYAMAVEQLAQKIIGNSIGVASRFIGDSVIPTTQLDTFLDSPLRGRKFIIDIN